MFILELRKDVWTVEGTFRTAMGFETRGLDERWPRRKCRLKGEPKNYPRGVPTFQDQVDKELLT